MSKEEIYQKAINRVNKNKFHSEKEIIIELEKEIDYYRDKIKKQNNNQISFQINPIFDSNELHSFLLAYVPMGRVLELYKYLKKDFER